MCTLKTKYFCNVAGNPTITPKKLVRSQWFHDPYTCGSYSYVAKGCSGQDIDNLTEPLPLTGSKAEVYYSIVIFITSQ